MGEAAAEPGRLGSPFLDWQKEHQKLRPRVPEIILAENIVIDRIPCYNE